MRQTTQIIEFLQRPFIRDAVTLQAGSVVSTGLSFVASLVYARVLGAELFGTYSLVIAFAGIVAVFFDLGATYSASTLLSEAVAKEDPAEIKSILGYYLKLSALVSFAVGAIAILLAPFISRVAYGRSDVGEFARWVILGQAVLFLFVFLTLVLLAARRMRLLTILENTQRFLEKALPIILVLLGFGILGIVFGILAAALIMAIVGLLLYVRFTRTNPFFPPLKELFGKLRTFSMKKYFWFGVQIAVDKNLGDLMSMIPVLLLGAFAARATVGHYRIAFAYMTLPLILLTPIGRLLVVHLPQVKARTGLAQARAQFWRASLASGALAALLVIPFVVLGPFLVRLFYGEEFLPAIPLTYWLIPYPVILGFGVGLGAMFRTLNQVKAAIWINGLSLLLGLPLAYWLIRTYGAKGVIFTLLFWAAVTIGASHLWLKRVFRLYERGNSGAGV
ncbi:oligosaccharide flippase family protein [Candidatus Azambacteria bacterium]|nr:oligosaccharide flippase family protein [Candidatus Azambacteria bacterium]